jgi:dihydroorotate dehydrogenase (NAD+) catalytic subunit
MVSEATTDMVVASTQASVGELPVIIQLPMERSLELAGSAIQAGAVAISLAAPRGMLPSQEGKSVQGRLYGPAILPMTLRVVHELTQLSIPVIGAGGIYTRQHVDAMLTAGALAVQLDSCLWCGAGSGILT